MIVTIDQLVLRSGALELALNPLVGGSIASFTWVDADGGRTPLMRNCTAADPAVLDMASFPLVPYVNRIRGGAFTFRGRDVRLRPNMAGDISPLHGHGWLSAWEVVSVDDASAVLHFASKTGEWPWAYEAHQQFALDDGLSVTLTCRNLADEPMPCGLGQHPYFPCGPETRLDTAVETAWTIDEHVLPVEQVPATGRFDLRDRLVCGQELDHGFGGWAGTARMSDPSWPVELELSSPTARFFQLYSPPTGELFVAEPVTHANAALNEPEERWAELGLRVLEPGEEMSLHMRIEVRVR